MRGEWGTTWGAPGGGEKPHSSLGRLQGAFLWEALPKLARRKQRSYPGRGGGEGCCRPREPCKQSSCLFSERRG